MLLTKAKVVNVAPLEARPPHCTFAFSAEATYLPIMKTKPKWKPWDKNFRRAKKSQEK